MALGLTLKRVDHMGVHRLCLFAVKRHAQERLRRKKVQLAFAVEHKNI